MPAVITASLSPRLLSLPLLLVAVIACTADLLSDPDAVQRLAAFAVSH